MSGSGRPLSRICQSCQQKFMARAADVRRGFGLYCSKHCMASRSGRRWKKKPGRDSQCLECGTPFYVAPHKIRSGEGRYCSLRCSGRASRRPTTTACEVCGTMFHRPPAKRKPHTFCSKTCYHQWQSKTLRGEHHHSWRGGTTVYACTPDWFEIRDRVIVRDGRRCVMCGSVAHLHVHHVVPYRIAKMHEMANLMTLCRVCHLRAHGRSKTSRQIEFVVYPKSR